MYQPSSSRRSSISSLLSSWSSHSDDEDLSHEHDHAPTFHSRQSISSERSCDGMTPIETRDLWRCMLELQERYGCYNSTRIDLAVGAGDDAVDLMPNPFIIDTLNESVHDLPDEGWEMLDRHLRHEASSKLKSRRKFWKRD